MCLCTGIRRLKVDATQRANGALGVGRAQRILRPVEAGIRIQTRPARRGGSDIGVLRPAAGLDLSLRLPPAPTHLHDLGQSLFIALLRPIAHIVLLGSAGPGVGGPGLHGPDIGSGELMDYFQSGDAESASVQRAEAVLLEELVIAILP